jgi:hypothetical protein
VRADRGNADPSGSRTFTATYPASVYRVVIASR